MTKQQYLLQKLQEECAEVIKEASKYAIFGPNDFSPLDPDKRPNRQKLADEIVDIMATVEMIGSEDMLPDLSPHDYEKAVRAKQAKVEKYMEVSRNLGFLEKESPQVQTPAND